MRNIYLLVVIICFVSCSSSAITKKLAASDSLVITFNYPNTDSVINSVSTTEKNAIKTLTRFIDTKEIAVSKCGFNGNMIFYHNGEIVMPVIFQYSIDSCRQFLFTIDNKSISTKMSNEAVDFLQSLEEGKSWY
jgi:hypothetical protein